MFIVGSDDGAYRISGIGGSTDAAIAKTLEAGRVMRVRQFAPLAGVFAATVTGLYHTPDGEEWTDLDAPRESVYSVGAGPAGDRLYAGTRPAAVYVADIGSNGAGPSDLDWRELDGFQELPSRAAWRLPRHENLAQVRDVHSPSPDRVVAGVEVGGVHVSDDGGETWVERREGSHDDVHELHAVTPEEWVAATGGGLYRTTDAGRTWTRLDGGVAQTYFRSVVSVGGTIYASGALANSSTWDDDDADPGLYACTDGATLEEVEVPRDETVTGMTAVEGDLVAGTHRGTLLVQRGDRLVEAATFPVPGRLTGRYTPLTWFEP